MAVTANLDAWNKLPPEDQQILLDAGREAQSSVDQQRVDLVARTLEKFKGQGVKICTPSQHELTRLRSVTEPVLAEFGALQTDKGHRIQDIARTYRAQVTQWGPTEGDTAPCGG